MKPKHIAFSLLAGAYLAVGIGLAGCATRSAPAIPSAACIATNAARLQLAKARVSIEQMKQKAPEVAAEARQSEDALLKADDALQESQTAIEAMQKQIIELTRARENEEAHRNFWRGAAWKLALLSLALGIWTLRKPLLALSGVPTL